MRLFWKLFLALLLSLSAIAAASSWFSQHWLLQSRQMEQRLDQLAGFADTAANLYVEQGQLALRGWLRHSQHQARFRGYLLDAGGEPLIGRGRPMPPEIEKLVHKAVADGKATSVVRPPHLISIVPVDTSQGRLFWVAGSLIEHDALQQNNRYALLLQLTLALATIILVSWLLSRMFTRPIRQLQLSASQLGSGRMDTRAPAGLTARGDELGELANSFDAMAVQLQGLMDSHKQLLRDVSHELRSPLARLTVALELARDSAGEAAQEDLQRIALEADRLNELIGEVLSLARFEQGAIDTDMVELDLAALLGEVAGDAAFEAEANDKQVEMAAPLPCRIRGDRLWLQRALDNVLRNAVRHTDRGTAVEVTMQPGKDRVGISVRDHGPGVPDEALEHIFEPFFRAEQARTRAGGGYGLGLAIAQRVVELHGGSIRAAHAEGGGLSVTIDLPVMP